MREENNRKLDALDRKQQPGAASGEQTREVQPDTFEAMEKRWRSPEYDKPYRGPAYCADELALLAQHYVSKERVRELIAKWETEIKTLLDHGNRIQAEQIQAILASFALLLLGEPMGGIYRTSREATWR